MSKYSYFDFTPMIVASIYGARAGGDLNAWKAAFLIGVSLSAIQFFIYRFLKRSIDPFALGLNLFLLVGAVGFNLMIPSILGLFDQMRESACFIFVAIVAVLYLFLKKEALLEFASPKSKMNSSFLVMLIVLCLFISYQFKGDQLFSITIPFMVLLSLRSYFNKKVQKSYL